MKTIIDELKENFGDNLLKDIGHWNHYEKDYHRGDCLYNCCPAKGIIKVYWQHFKKLDNDEICKIILSERYTSEGVYVCSFFETQQVPS